MKTKSSNTHRVIKQSESDIKVLIQTIHLSWDKEARGGLAAAQRNSVASAFVFSHLNSLTSENNAFLIEQQFWGQKNQFSQPVYCCYLNLKLDAPYISKCITVKYLEEVLKVEYKRNQQCGAPLAPVAKSLTISLNQWIQIRWNGRFSDIDTGAWWYEQTTMNIGLFQEAVDCDVFTKSSPAVHFDQLFYLR